MIYITFHIFSKINQVPTRAVVLAGAWATGVTFLSSGIAAQVTGIVSVVLYVTYGLSLLSAYLGQKNNRKKTFKRKR